jgi:catechol 2,3-dioxygenase-like lactoylglutathione lyase family enzyme
VEQRISLVTIGVEDLGRSRAFYEALGWRTDSTQDSEVVFFQAGGMIFGLWGREQLAADSGLLANPPGAVTLAYNVASRTDLDAAIAEAAAAGARILRAPAETFWGGYTAVFHDPDGHPWESPTTRRGTWRPTDG